MTMRIQQWVPLLLVMVIFGEEACRARPHHHHHHHRILLDTDVGIDDVFALLYLLKLDRAEFDLKGVTLNANGWSDAGHAVNHVYDILYMMGRDDIPVGVGGEGGILEGGTILPNVGGYLPLIEQGMSTTGYCRYRQAIPVGSGGGRLDIDTNFGIRKEFLPQGSRRYSPMGQATAQQVMIDVISEGPTNVLLTGAQTNFAIFLMSNPQLKSNVQHIYAMGGSLAIGATNCCRYPNTEMSSSCKPSLCGEPAGNLFSNHDSNPYAEFNMFSDPFAAYQVIHSGIPVTLVPLDATNTIPITRQFYDMLEKNQRTYEAQYVYKSMKMVHDTRLDDMFFNNYYIWDTFAAGVAVSIMSKPDNTDGENDFANMKYVNITLVTSNKPYGISDGSNPFFDGCQIPRFHLENGGVHSGHVQTRLHDPFCSIKKNEKGKCQDGYTMVTTGSEAAQVLVATEAKPSKVPSSLLDREFFVSFLEVLNRPQNSGRFNFTTQFPHYMPVYYKPNFVSTKLGKPIIFDIDMSAGDFLALFYLLKVPVEVLDLKAVLVTPTGWASAATVEVVYDLLHMMGRDDIPVGLGDFFAMNQSDPIYAGVGDCNYSKAIPNGRGGLLDSDTLYGLARDLPRSPRRYTVENSIKYGAPRDTDHPELRQASALETWKNVTSSTDHGSKITVLTNGPLTTLAKIILLEENSRSLIEEVYIVGGYVNYSTEDKGNLFTVPSNDFAEFNMFLDPLAAKTVFDSELVVTLIPLDAQRQVCSFPRIHEKLYQTKRTPEALFAQRLLSQLERLQKEHPGYKHMDIFLGEILGAVILAGDYYHLNSTKKAMQISVFAPGNESIDGQIAIDGKDGKPVNVLEEVNQTAFADIFASRLGERKQSAVLEY